MARVYTPEQEEEVYSLLCDGLGLTEIQRTLEAGKGGLKDPLHIPYSSLKAIRKRMVRKHGDPRKTIPPEKEAHAASASRRRIVAVFRDNIELLVTKHHEHGSLEPNELRTLGYLEERMRAIEDRAKQPAQDKTNTPQSKGHQTRKSNDPRTLAEIAKRAEAEAQEPASSSTLSNANAEGEEGVSPAQANGSSPTPMPA